MQGEDDQAGQTDCYTAAEVARKTGRTIASVRRWGRMGKFGARKSDDDVWLFPKAIINKLRLGRH